MSVAAQLQLSGSKEVSTLNKLHSTDSRLMRAFRVVIEPYTIRTSSYRRPKLERFVIDTRMLPRNRTTTPRISYPRIDANTQEWESAIAR